MWEKPYYRLSLYQQGVAVRLLHLAKHVSRFPDFFQMETTQNNKLYIYILL